MANSVYIPMSAAVAADNQISVVSNNLANVDTAGFKQLRTSFRSFLVDADGAPTEKGFTAMVETRNDLAAGSMRQTGNPLDVALGGDGFLMLRTPNGDVLTRAGNLHMSGDGTLLNASGHPVLAGDLRQGELTPVSVDPTGGPVTIGTDGRLSQGGTPLALLTVVTLDDPKALRHLEGSNYTAPVENLAMATSPDVQQGYLEDSNVNAVHGMIELIEANRDFERAAKLMNQFQQLDKRALDVI